MAGLGPGPGARRAAASYLAEERLQLGQSDDGGLDQNLAVVIVRALQAALQTLERKRRNAQLRERSREAAAAVEAVLLPGRCSAGGWPC